MPKNTLTASAALIALLSATSMLATGAHAVTNKDIDKLKDRIADLEAKLEGRTGSPSPMRNVPATAHRSVKDSSFNPSIGLVLNGRYSRFSEDESEIAGFAVGHGGEGGDEGFSVEHTELNFAANVDDKFRGSVTAAIAEHESEEGHGTETELELEEAYVQTLPGAGLPRGLSVKMGRAFWTLGYLNEHHAHADDFADRPLPNRVFLDGGFNDDGVEVSYVLPTRNLYAEIGGGAFRGDDFPFGESGGDSLEARSVFVRLGGDIGRNQSWRVGGYTLSGDVGGRESNEEMLEFSGDTDLQIVDFRYTYAPSGNAREREIILQGEYFRREEDGVYETDDGMGNEVEGDFDDSASGWYAQAVYKFAPRWRIGARYSKLNAADAPASLASALEDWGTHDPKAYAVMMDWTNSEFSRIRLQYNREELADGQDDSQTVLQYVMSLGAHGAHKY